MELETDKDTDMDTDKDRDIDKDRDTYTDLTGHEHCRGHKPCWNLWRWIWYPMEICLEWSDTLMGDGLCFTKFLVLASLSTEIFSKLFACKHYTNKGPEDPFL